MVPPLAAFFSLFYFIPHTSGSRARAKRVSASDIDPLSRLNHTVSGNSTYAFLSAISPGFFLDLQVSREYRYPLLPFHTVLTLYKGHTSLVKVYGHKRAGASLYGVHLVCGSGGFQTVDGYDPSIPTLLDDQPVSRQSSFIVTVF
jgi:hypothetical protein